MFKEIRIEDLKFNPFTKISKEWTLITSGKENNYNMMTASWCTLGHLWNVDVATIFVRPQRYTKKFVDENEYFSLCFFDNQNPLKICGTISGRDFDKAKKANITPIFKDNTTFFEEARLVFVCKKIYEDIIKDSSFIDDSLKDKVYPEKDFHTMYIGKIVKVYIKE